MKIDFRKITVQDVDGNKSTVDVSKELGNIIYKNTPDLGELEFAQDIYKNGEVDIDEARAEIIRRYMDVGRFFAFVRVGINEELNSINPPE